MKLNNKTAPNYINGAVFNMSSNNKSVIANCSINNSKFIIIFITAIITILLLILNNKKDTVF